MTTKFKVFMSIIVLIFGSLLANTVRMYLSPRLDVGFLAVKQDVVHLQNWRIAFYIHVFSSVFVIFIGLTQFSQGLRRRYRWLHVLMGRAYVAIVLLIAGPTGFILALYALGGPLSKGGFLGLAILWLLFTFLAYHHAVRRNIKQHQNYMTRSYALTLNAITVRFLGYLAVAFPIVSQLEAYRISSWLAWMINLSLAELLIRERDSRPRVSEQQIGPSKSEKPIHAQRGLALGK